MSEDNPASSEAKFRRNLDLIGAAIDDELVMMSVEQGQYYGLGGIGPRVWELLEEPCAIEDLVDAILEEFEVDSAVCEKDMTGFLKELEEFGLIQKV